MLGNYMVVGVDVFPSAGQVDAFALGLAFWFYNEDFVLYFLLFFEIRFRFFLLLGRWTYWFRFWLFYLLFIWLFILL